MSDSELQTQDSRSIAAGFFLEKLPLNLVYYGIPVVAFALMFIYKMPIEYSAMAAGVSSVGFNLLSSIVQRRLNGEHVSDGDIATLVAELEKLKPQLTQQDYYEGLRQLAKHQTQLSQVLQEQIATMKQDGATGELVRQLDRQFRDLLARLAESRPRTAGLVPSPPDFNIARHTKFQEVVEALDSQNMVIFLHGMSGSGKTTLASSVFRYIETTSDRFRDGIYWLSFAQDSHDCISQLRTIAHSFGETDESYGTERELAGRVSQLLKGKSCLIVLDNIWYSNQVELFLDICGVSCRLVVTTQIADLRYGGNATEIHIDSLSDEEALELLGNWIGIPAHRLPLEATKVVAKCGNLAFAVALCGAMAKDNVSWGEISDALNGVTSSHIQRKLPNYEFTSWQAAIKISIDTLALTYPNALSFYQLLLVFREGKYVPENAILDVFVSKGVEERYAAEILLVLQRRSLLLGQRGNRGKEYKLHDLHREYLKLISEQDEISLHEALLDAYRQNNGGTWHRGTDDGYYFQNLAYHLLKGHHGEDILVPLLTSTPEWINARLTCATEGDDVSDDIRLALSLFSDPLTPFQFRTLTQLYSVLSVVQSKVDIFTDEELQTLVLLDRLTEATRYALTRSDPHRRFKGALAIHQLCRETHLRSPFSFSNLFDMVSTIPAINLRVTGLCDLADTEQGHIEEHWIDRLFSDAERTARQIPDTYTRIHSTVYLIEKLARSNRADRGNTLLSDLQNSLSLEEEIIDSLLTLIKALGLFDRSVEVRRMFDLLKGKITPDTSAEILCRIAVEMLNQNLDESAIQLAHTIRSQYWQVQAFGQFIVAYHVRKNEVEATKLIPITFQIIN